MKKKIIIISIFSLFIFMPSFSLAETGYSLNRPEQVIMLNDGTKIIGQLINVSNGIYTIETKHLGEMQVSVDDLKSISNSKDSDIKDTQTKNAGTENLNKDIQKNPTARQDTLTQIQQKAMSDPKVTSGIQELVNDPEIMKLIQDPKIMEAVTNMDPESLQNSKSAQELMKNPKMKKIMDQIGESLNLEQK